MAATEKLVFEALIDGLFPAAQRKRLAPELKAKLKAAGLDLDRSLLPGYPVAQGVRWIHIAAEESFPGVPKSEALRRLGQQFLGGWEQSLLGKAAAGVMKVIGPRRTLLRLERAFRTGDNFTTVAIEELGERKIRVRFIEGFGIPEYYAGVLEQGGAMTGAKNTRVTIEDPMTLLVEWD